MTILELPGAAAAGRALSVRGGLLQSAYHIQLLAMTANLAAPGISESYRELARFFRWWVMVRWRVSARASLAQSHLGIVA
jgi:hypothetical protein